MYIGDVYVRTYVLAQLYVLLVASMAETALHLECVHVPLGGLVVTVDKVRIYSMYVCHFNTYCIHE